MRVSVVYGEYDLTHDTPVGRAYCYEADKSVQVGDVVLVPATWIVSEPQKATVVGLGSDCTGHAMRILSVLDRKGTSEEPSLPGVDK